MVITPELLTLPSLLEITFGFTRFPLIVIVCILRIYHVSPVGILLVIIFIVSPSTPLVPMPGGYGVRIPFVKNASETDTGVDLPEGMIVSDVIVEVTNKVASATIDVGLLSTEDNNGGDADGFLDAEDCGTANGFVKHNTVALTSAAATITLGDYFKEAGIADATAGAGAQTYRVPNYHVVGSGQVSVSYTTSNSANLAGNFYMVCAAPGFQIVGRAEETLAVATATVNDATVFVSQDVMARVYI